MNEILVNAIDPTLRLGRKIIILTHRENVAAQKTSETPPRTANNILSVTTYCLHRVKEIPTFSVCEGQCFQKLHC